MAVNYRGFSGVFMGYRGGTLVRNGLMLQRMLWGIVRDLHIFV